MATQQPLTTVTRDNVDDPYRDRKYADTTDTVLAIPGLAISNAKI